MGDQRPCAWGSTSLPFLFFAVAVMGAGNACAQSLVDRSPFLPPDFQRPSSSENAPIEQPVSVQHLRFQGVFALNGEIKVNLFNTQTNKGTWVPLNGIIDGHRVVAYDSVRRSVDLEVDGEITRFDLARPTDSPLAVVGGTDVNTPNRRITRPTSRGGSTTVSRRRVVPPRPGGSSASSRNVTPGSGRRTVTQPAPPPNSTPRRRSNSD